ncbi:MAG: YdhR family protein [Gammaproteobacteria bacterium]
MITAIVQFEIPEPVGLDKARELFLGSAQKYRNTSGLIRKYYLRSEDGKTVGGVYLWESRAAAERTYTAEWRRTILDKFGSEAVLTYFDSPVIVDNEKGTISQS